MTARLRRRWLTVDGRRIHVREGVPAVDRPERPTVVLVHGFIISSRYMRPFAAALARRGWRSIAPDLPGLGHSQGDGVEPEMGELARWLARTLEAAGVRPPVVLVANSMGCQVAARLAVQEPEWADRLVLVGPTFEPDVGLLRNVGRLLLDMPRERLTLWAEHVPDIVRAGPVRIMSMLRHGRRHRIERDLARIEAPVLVMRGSRDPIAPSRWIRAAAAVAPRGQAMELLGAPHAANYSTPDLLADGIGPFLE